jgi:hypothetical protein
MTRSEINGRQTSECRPACRLDRRDPVIVDEQVDKRRAVAIESPTYIRDEDASAILEDGGPNEPGECRRRQPWFERQVR